MSTPVVSRGADGLARFEMTFSPSPPLVALVRRFVGAFCEQLFHDHDLGSRVAVGTHELLENALRYSNDGETTLCMELDDRARPIVVTIRTRNRVALSNADAVARHLHEIDASADVHAHYQLLMRRTAKTDHAGGLGLGRVASEAEMRLSYTLDGDILEVVARTSPARRRVLVMDDSDIILAAVTPALVDAGFEVRTASSLRRFLNAMHDWKPHVVVTDLYMPEMTGAQLCAWLREQVDTARTPIVMWSSAPGADLERIAPEVGADAYLSKDAGVTELARRLLELCNEILW